MLPKMVLMKFQELSENEVQKMPCTILTDTQGKRLAIVIVPQTDYIQEQADYLSEVNNAVL